ncbi:PDZ domain-containing protein [Naumannella sp. ID2617S]|nr:PDZ domain-containing protein [Naumannella sp. ID2617S]
MTTNWTGPQYTPPTMPQQAWAPPVAQPAPQVTRKRRGAALLVLPAALLAALASSGLTVAGLHATTPAATAGSTSTVNTVVQGSPANPDWSQTVKVAAPSVVAIAVQGRTGSAEGSGVIYDASGLVVTNNHVVNGVGTGARLQVTLANQQVYAATLVGADASTDLAVIRLTDPPADLQPITFGDVGQLTVGQPVMALGNPLGLSQTVTTGIISALDRPVITQQSGGTAGAASRTAPEQSVTNAIQTNAAINPGNSGGALVDVNGRLIGITSSIATLGSGQGESGNIGIGFAIPANEVRSTVDQLISGGAARHAYLGVSAVDATGKVGQATFSGAGVRQVVAGSPADQAGLKTGDVVLAINGEAVPSSDALIAQVRDHNVGERVTLKVARDGQAVELPVTLATGQ